MAINYTNASEEVLKTLLANPSALGLNGQVLVDELQRISVALVQRLSVPKRQVMIRFQAHEHRILGGDVNSMFYVLVDGNGTFHTNLTQPDLLAIQNETEFGKAGFRPGGIGLREKTFDVSGKEGYLVVFSDRYSGIEEKTKQIASVLLASNKLKELKFGADAVSWKSEIEEGGKYLAKLAKMTPLGDYSDAVNEATSLLVKIYTYIKEQNFKSVARVVHFSSPPAALPAGVEVLPAERTPLYTFNPGAPVPEQMVNLYIGAGHRRASFWIESVPPVPVPPVPDVPRYEKAQRARRFFEQNLLKEPAWVTNTLEHQINGDGESKKKAILENEPSIKTRNAVLY
jgi:hypothetical protein